MKQHTQLPFFGVIRATGEDRQNFLHTQLSNDIKNLTPQQACYATYNTAKGRVIANMIVYNTGEDILVILAADLVEIVIKRLKMFVLRAKVQFEQLTNWGIAGCLDTNQPPTYPNEPQLQLSVHKNHQIQLPHGGILQVQPLTQLPSYQTNAEQQWQQHEILSGYPWISAVTTETCVAQMLNQHQIGGIHFRKGCYPGQEIIARAQYRGQVKRGLAVASNAQTQQVGQNIYSENQEEVGTIINSCQNQNLLVIKHNAANTNIQDVSGNPFKIEHIFFNTTEKEN